MNTLTGGYNTHLIPSSSIRIYLHLHAGARRRGKTTSGSSSPGTRAGAKAWWSRTRSATSSGSWRRGPRSVSQSVGGPPSARASQQNLNRLTHCPPAYHLRTQPITQIPRSFASTSPAPSPCAASNLTCASTCSCGRAARSPAPTSTRSASRLGVGSIVSLNTTHALSFLSLTLSDCSVGWYTARGGAHGQRPLRGGEP